VSRGKRKEMGKEKKDEGDRVTRVIMWVVGRG